MGTFKDLYDILKDLIQEAKKLKNQEIVLLSTEVQAKLFDFKEEIEDLKDENKKLKEEIKSLKKPIIDESNIVYSPNGFFTLKSEGESLPYCSACWKLEHKLVPLSRQAAWYNYKCSNCKSTVIVMTKDGNPL